MVVNRILEEARVSRISDLVGMPDFASSVFDQHSPLRLVAQHQVPLRATISSPRVGLSLGKDDADKMDFFMRSYRFLIVPEQTTKGKPYLVLSLYRQGKTEGEITEITQTKKSSVKSYIALYDQNSNPREHFLGRTLSSASSCEAVAAFLKI